VMLRQVPSTSQWCILAIDSDSLFVKNNILLSFSNKGSLDIETSCTNYFGDYNLLNDKMTINQGNSYINFTSWQALGHDLHSILIKDNASVFENFAVNDYHLSSNSPALNSGTNEVAALIKNDLDNNARPQEGKYDIGCYEKLGTTRVYEDFKNQKFSYIDLGSAFSFSELNEDYVVAIYDLQNKRITSVRNFEKNIFIPGIYIYRIFSLKDHKQFAAGKVFISN
jgi:hypothetical protein